MAGKMANPVNPGLEALLQFSGCEVSSLVEAGLCGTRARGEGVLLACG